MNRLGTARVQHDGFSRILPMGTRQNSPGWETHEGFGTPPSSSPLHDRTISGHAPGAGTGEPPGALREEETIHRFRSPFWKGTGLFLWAG